MIGILSQSVNIITFFIFNQIRVIHCCLVWCKSFIYRKQEFFIVVYGDCEYFIYYNETKVKFIVVFLSSNSHKVLLSLHFSFPIR